MLRKSKFISFVTEICWLLMLEVKELTWRYNFLDYTDVDISLIAQEEMIWEQRFVCFAWPLNLRRMCFFPKWIFNSNNLYSFLQRLTQITCIPFYRGMAYAMYYKPKGQGIEPRCPDFETFFSKAIQSRITAKASNGQVITVSYAIESALVTESSAFSFNIQLTEPIAKSHIGSLEEQLSEKWTAQLSGTGSHLLFILLQNCNDYSVKQILHLNLYRISKLNISFQTVLLTQCYVISLYSRNHGSEYFRARRNDDNIRVGILGKHNTLISIKTDKDEKSVIN